MNKSLATRLIRSFVRNKLSRVRWYREVKPYLKAIILYGSVAKGLAHPGSDIDVLIIVPLEIEVKYTKGEYFYRYKNNVINIVLRSVERLRKLSNERRDIFQANIFWKSKIIWASDCEVKNLIKLLLTALK